MARASNDTLDDEPLNLMSKSLTSSLQQAVSTVREMTQLHQTVPYLGSVLEHPLALLTKNELLDTAVASAEECFELPPIKHLPNDLSENVLESIINEFKDVSSDAEELRRVKSEELQRKLRLYNSIMEQRCEGEVIHSRRGRRRDASSGSASPRAATPARSQASAPAAAAAANAVSYTSPCLMNVSVYGNGSQSDDLLEKQIEEKEKILAKMLNLESLSIAVPNTERPVTNDVTTTFKHIEVTPFIEPTPTKIKEPEIKHPPKVNAEEAPKPIDLVPKIVKLPNNWNLGDIELKLEMRSNGVKDPRNILSPDDHIESDWEII